MALYYAAIHRVHVPRLRGLTERGEEKLGRKSTPASNPPVGSWVLDFDSRLRGRLEATLPTIAFASESRFFPTEWKSMRNEGGKVQARKVFAGLIDARRNPWSIESRDTGLEELSFRIGFQAWLAQF